MLTGRSFCDQVISLSAVHSYARLRGEVQAIAPVWGETYRVMLEKLLVVLGLESSSCVRSCLADGQAFDCFSA